MEAFRRLRSRRKSKGQADSFVSFSEAESGLRSPTNPWQSSTGRSSVTVSRPSDAERLSHDHFRQPNSPTEARRPGSNGRIQPVLIGISRPLNNSRPNTAESFQNALDRAADSVMYSPARRTVSPSQQLGLNTGKYVDIFAVAGQTGNLNTTFNEDVAERNLDTIALTMAEAPYHYQPTSKYQEEVATRNAHQIATQRAWLLQNPPVSESVKAMSNPSESVASHTNQSQLEETARHRQVQDLTAYHSRQNSSRARDVTERLPPIPQEGTSDRFATTFETRKEDMVSRVQKEVDAGKSHGLETNAPDDHHEHPYYDKSLPSSPRKEDRLRVSDLSSHATSNSNRKSDVSSSQYSEWSTQEKYQSTRQSIDRRVDRMADYQVSASNTRTRTRPTTSNVRRSDAHVDNARRLEPLRLPSNMSSPPSVMRSMTVGNRRVMDLTGDDSELFSVISYINTPVVHDATTDAFQKVRPAVVQNHPPNKIMVEKDPAIPNSRWSSAFEPVLDLDRLARRSQMISDTAKAAATANSQQSPLPKERSKTPPAKGLAFSPIQTLTSTTPPRTFTFSSISTLSISPRSSQVTVSPQEEALSAPLPIPVSEIGRRISRQNLRASEPDSASQRSSTRISAKIAPLVKVFVDVSPEEVERMPQPVVEASRSLPKRSDLQRLPRENDTAQQKDGKKREKTLDSSTDSKQRIVKTAVPPGPIDQEAVPGVKTRDFAMVPLEKPTVKRIEALTERKRLPGNPRRSSKEDVSLSSAMKASSSSDKKSRSRSSRPTDKVAFEEKPMIAAASDKHSERKLEKKSNRKSSRQTSSTSKKTRPVSIFDEESFKKKQIEATAALLRLQESLQENLDDMSGQETPRDTATPADRALSPVASISNNRTPDPEESHTQHHPSPSQAAIAMIAAATSSPRNRTRPTMNGKSYSEYTQSSRDQKRSAPASRANTENGVPTIRSVNSLSSNVAASNPMLAPIDMNNQPPPSPGEVSLSAFPLPTPRALSPEVKQSPPSYTKDVAPTPVRRGSQASRVSSGSVFSIPFTMVPGRGSSLPLRRIPVPGPSTTTTMNSIDSIIPPSKPVNVDAP